MPDLSVMIVPQPRPWRRLAMLACLACSLATQAATASGRHDHERARAALQSGQILPLPTVLQRLEREHPGQVLEVELEQEEGRWIYEVKSLQADGHLVKFKLDAATGAVSKRKAR
ncbi:PepSY domain-containing protein [Lacisediminimonas sp.]|uniref:PepSY domain-containing protein n=1 Tax=Lacisediminimonas sp. TaxID=3060582 RepID=UPI00272591CE|nr:PepSY domain-containing protein [Lacisediminimonas sp.]MDO8298937.1 PepSY domain-containing protein [Lacisediminimonas sp.]